LEHGRFKGPELELKRFILIRCFASEISGYKAEEQFNWSRGCQKVQEVAGELGLALPSGWDQPPVHTTPTNCHVCGQFAPGGEITGRDRERGWQVEGGVVTCSDDCRVRLAAPPPPAPSKKVSRRKSQPAKKSRPKRGRK
jgi:hypothetical protein